MLSQAEKSAVRREAARKAVATRKARQADVAARIAALEAAVAGIDGSGHGTLVREIRVRVADKAPVTISGHTHEVFPEVLELLEAGENVYLPGPAGCGKTHLASQGAEALGLPFASISCSAGMSEAQLLGRLVPRGESGQFEFVGTQFLEMYENGGVFLFDEFDAADPNVVLVINSALANGHVTVPNRPEKPVATRHANFRAIAAANTFGRGADRQYVGRSQMDEATLDRFRLGTVPMDYDTALEQAQWEAIISDLSGLRQLRKYRERIADAKLQRCLSMRFAISAAKALARGRDFEYVESKLFAGWRDDEVRKVRGN